MITTLPWTKRLRLHIVLFYILKKNEPGRKEDVEELISIPFY